MQILESFIGKQYTVLFIIETYKYKQLIGLKYIVNKY